MSLDEKSIDPLAPAMPGQNPDLSPKPSKKRRKSEGGSSRKAKKIEDDEDGSSDMTAVLKMDEAPRKQKKMLFEPDADSAPVSLTPIARRDNGSTRAALSGTAAVMPAPVSTPVPPPPAPKAAAPLPEPAPVPTPTQAAPEPIPAAPAPVVSAREEPQPPAAAPEPAVEPIADMKGSVFQVATLVMREPDPAPSPEPMELPQGSLDLGTSIDAGIESAAAVAPDLPEEAAADEPRDAQPELALVEAETVAEAAPETFIPAEPVEDVAVAPQTPSVSEAPAEHAAAAVEAIEPAKQEEPAPVPTPAPAVQPTPARAFSVAAQPKPQETPPAEAAPPARLSRSEMIARAARMSALSSSRANGSTAGAVPAPRPVAPPTLPQPQQRTMELPKHAGDLYGYWTRVKNGRRFPSRADFDVEQMAENFPNSMLLTCGNGGGQVNFSSILRLGANRRSQPGESLNFTSMITEWILAIGGEAVRAGTPVQDTEVFPSPEGTFAYKIVALPLSDQQSRVEHVLCHLSRS